MEKLGLGPKTLCPENKGLIYARLTGYGQNGPMSKVAGHDINYLALSGLLSLFGRSNDKPTSPINFGADFAGGSLVCALGIIIALFNRQKSGHGQVIDCSMVEGAAYVGSWLYRSQSMDYIWPNKEMGKNLLDSGFPLYDTYKTKDALFMAVGALEPQFMHKLLQALNNPFDAMELQTNPEKCRRILTDLFATKTRDQWTQKLMHLDACVTPVLNLHEAPKDSHAIYRKSFVPTEITEVPALPIRAPKFGDLHVPLNLHESQVGEHSMQVLHELGIPTEEIQQLIHDKIIEQPAIKAKL